MSLRSRLALFLGALLSLHATSITPTRASEFAVPETCWNAEDLLTYLPNDVGLGGLIYAPDGALLAYGLREGILQKSQGDVDVDLATFPDGTFGSFLAIPPESDVVIFGESTLGNIYQVPLAGGDPVIVDNIPFNYDIAIHASGAALISAPGPSGDNQIYRTDGDPDTLSPAVITDIPGFSGPLTLDDAGNLFYGTALFDGSLLEIHRFTAAQVEGALAGTPVPFSEGELVVSGIEGNFDLEWHAGKLYYTDLGFGAAQEGRVIEVDTENGFTARTLVRFPSIGDALVSPTYLAVRSGEKDFACGSGKAGGAIAVGFSDFASFTNVSEFTLELHFVRGEVNGAAPVDVSDVLFLLEFLFLAGEAPDPVEAADVNDDGEADISDPIRLINYLFLGAAPPPPPFPEAGVDPTS